MGDWLAQQLQSRLDGWSKQMHGYHLLKLGELSGELSCFNSNIFHQVTVTSNKGMGGVYSDLTHLPFQENCINACILTQSLDFSEDPHQILREVERVLTADGYLVISGYNPLSLCGLVKACGFKRRALPWSGRMFTPARIKDWLSLLGFDVIEDERFAFTTFLGKKPINWWSEGVGQMYLPAFASIYFIVARKRRAPLSPINNWWQVKKRPRRLLPNSLPSCKLKQ